MLDTKKLLVDNFLMSESEYEKFDKAIRDSQPIYYTDQIYEVVAEIIQRRIDELY